MPRPAFLELLQSYPFWVFDPGVLGGTFLPSVFDPALAFASCSSPEVVAETYQIKQLVSRHRRPIVRSANTSAISLTRGVRWWDSDFYMWMTAALRGERGARKTIFLVHFLTTRLLTVADKRPGQAGRLNMQPETGLNILSTRIPARAWVLRGCLPVKYKAGNDFDANSAEVSVAQLDIQPESFDEVTVGTLSQTTARSFSLGVGIADLAGADVG